jgi:hypothetical protein
VPGGGGRLVSDLDFDLDISLDSGGGDGRGILTSYA